MNTLGFRKKRLPIALRACNNSRPRIALANF
jgi:hypothetical protein